MSTQGLQKCNDDARQYLVRWHSRLLVNEPLEKLTEVRAALRELITGGAEGNPFYIMSGLSQFSASIVA